MGNDRVNPFEKLDSLDDFAVKDKPQDAPSKQEVDELSEKLGFPSRQAPTPSVPKETRTRRYTTGRNRQLNLKVTSAAMDRFYTLADQMEGVPLGEIFDQAIKMLAESQGKKS